MVTGAAAAAGALVWPPGAAGAAPPAGAAAVVGAAGLAAPLAPLLVLPWPQATMATRARAGIARLKVASISRFPPPPPPHAGAGAAAARRGPGGARTSTRGKSPTVIASWARRPTSRRGRRGLAATRY